MVGLWPPLFFVPGGLMDAALTKRVQGLAEIARQKFQADTGRPPDAERDTGTGNTLFNTDWASLKSGGTAQSDLGDCRSAWEVCFYQLQTAGRG